MIIIKIFIKKNSLFIILNKNITAMLKVTTSNYVIYETTKSQFVDLVQRLLVSQPTKHA